MKAAQEKYDNHVQNHPQLDQNTITSPAVQSDGDVQESTDSALPEMTEVLQTVAPLLQLSEKQLKIKSILDSRMEEYLKAIEYAQSVLNDTESVFRLLEIAEDLKKCQTQISNGQDLTSEQIQLAKPVSGEILFGYNEEQRKARIKAVYDELVQQAAEISQKCIKFEAA